MRKLLIALANAAPLVALAQAAPIVSAQAASAASAASAAALSAGAAASSVMFLASANPWSLVTATGALLAFLIGLFTLVGRERKAPYLINSVFLIFLL